MRHMLAATLVATLLTTGCGDDADDGPCAAQDATWDGTECAATFGYAWDGGACVEIICGCRGTDCDAIEGVTQQACEESFAGC